ncbi:MAG: PspA/IM30 family protein [Gammaproteobacteria bacterium]
MALITRLSRLFRADLHAVLDRVEEPDVLLRQAIREMDEELEADQQRMKLLELEQGQLVARAGELERSLADLEEELNVCFDSGKDDLARRTIRRRLEAQRLLKFLGNKREALEQDLGELQARVAENRLRLDSMRQKSELLSEDNPDPRPEELWAMADIAVHDEVVEVAFLREQLKRRSS